MLHDYRGFSNSNELISQLSIHKLAHDCVELIDHIEIEGDIHIMGLSLGSMVGLGLLTNFKDKISSFTSYGFVCPTKTMLIHVISIFQQIESYFNKISRNISKARISPQNIEELAKPLWDVFVIDHSKAPKKLKKKGYTPSYGHYILKYTRNTPFSSLCKLFNMFSMDKLDNYLDYSRYIPSLEKNIKIMQGKDDLITPFCEVEKYCKKIPQITFSPIIGSGHTDIMRDSSLCNRIAYLLLENIEVNI